MGTCEQHRGPVVSMQGQSVPPARDGMCRHILIRYVARMLPLQPVLITSDCDRPEPISVVGAATVA